MGTQADSQAPWLLMTSEPHQDNQKRSHEAAQMVMGGHVDAQIKQEREVERGREREVERGRERSRERSREVERERGREVERERSKERPDAGLRIKEKGARSVIKRRDRTRLTLQNKGKL